MMMIRLGWANFLRPIRNGFRWRNNIGRFHFHGGSVVNICILRTNKVAILRESGRAVIEFFRGALGVKWFDVCGDWNIIDRGGTIHAQLLLSDPLLAGMISPFHGSGAKSVEISNRGCTESMEIHDGCTWDGKHKKHARKNHVNKGRQRTRNKFSSYTYWTSLCCVQSINHSVSPSRSI